MNKIALTALAAVIVFTNADAVFAYVDPSDETHSRGFIEDVDQENDAHYEDGEDDGDSHEGSADHEDEESMGNDHVFDSDTGGFIGGSHLSIHLRNAYFKHKHSHMHITGGDTTRHRSWSQWGQSLSANYTSGYMWDILGFDASVYSAQKLDASATSALGNYDQLLHLKDRGAPDAKYSNNYSRIGLLNAKVNLHDERFGSAMLRAGFIDADSVLLSTSDSRLLESSYRGISASMDFTAVRGLSLYGYYVDRIAMRTGTSYDRFTAGTDDEHTAGRAAGSTISNIQVYGVNYVLHNLTDNSDSLAVRSEYGVSKNFIKQYFGQAVYHAPLTENIMLVGDLQYRQSEKAGNDWSSTRGFDKKASNFNANVMSVFDDIRVALSYAATSAKRAGDSHCGGKFNYALANNDYGNATFWTSRQISDFNHDGERAYQAMVGYDFTEYGLTGLDMKLTHTYGKGMRALKDEKETDLSVGYTFSQKALEGLSMQLEHAWYSSQSGVNATGVANGAGKKVTDLRLLANYNIAVF